MARSEPSDAVNSREAGYAVFARRSLEAAACVRLSSRRSGQQTQLRSSACAAPSVVRYGGAKCVGAWGGLEGSAPAGRHALPRLPPATAGAAHPSHLSTGTRAKASAAATAVAQPSSQHRTVVPARAPPLLPRRRRRRTHSSTSKLWQPDMVPKSRRRPAAARAVPRSPAWQRAEAYRLHNGWPPPRGARCRAQLGSLWGRGDTGCLPQ